MKRAIAITGSILLILTAVSCALGALISAFSFSPDMKTLYVFWAVAAAALVTITVFLRVKGILILSIPALIMLYINFTGIINGAKWVICSITSEYNKWLYVPVLFSGASASPLEVTVFFTALGILLIFLLSPIICLHHNVTLTILYTAPFAALTVVLVESTPDIRCFVGLLVVYLTMIISNSLHPNDYMKRALSVFPAIALTAVLLLAAYLISPPDNYRRSNLVDNIDVYIRDAADKIGMELNKNGIGWPGYGYGKWEFDTVSVGVSNSGSRGIYDVSLLEITSSEAGTFYLKGYSMADFNGREWRTAAAIQQNTIISPADFMPSRILGFYINSYSGRVLDVSTMKIEKTGDSSDIFYMPYYSVVQRIDDSPYTIYFYHLKDSVLGYFYENKQDDMFLAFISGSDIRVSSAYTQIDDSTKKGLRQLALDAGIDPNADRAVIADKVAEYISSAARYTLNPYVVPDSEDFAIYFLQNSKRGFCIHFATAAALMLRALDIPARFTSGFIVTVPEDSVGETVVVTDRNAHAWVEVFYDNVGWLPLEATPASAGSAVQGALPHTAVSRPGPSTPTPTPTENDRDIIKPDDDNPRDHDYDPGAANPAQTGQPGTGPEPGAGQDQKKGPGRAVIIILLIFAGLAVFAGALFLNRLIITKYRDKQFAQEDTNMAVIFVWKYISKLRRWEAPPKDIEELALKACFSQHLITEEERALVTDRSMEFCAAVYDRQNRVIRLWLKYFRGI